MARRFRLRPLPGAEENVHENNPVLDRREFMRYSFNTAAGVITMASLGSIGFASLLMGTSDSSGGDTAVRFWVPTGAEDSAWYGDRHLEPKFLLLLGFLVIQHVLRLAFHHKLFDFLNL